MISRTTRRKEPNVSVVIQYSVPYPYRYSYSLGIIPNAIKSLSPPRCKSTSSSIVDRLAEGERHTRPAHHPSRHCSFSSPRPPLHSIQGQHSLPKRIAASSIHFRIILNNGVAAQDENNSSSLIGSVSMLPLPPGISLSAAVCLKTFVGFVSGA